VRLPVGDLDASRLFHSVALAPLEHVLVYDGESSLGFGRGDGGGDDEPFVVERRTTDVSAGGITSPPRPSGKTHVLYSILVA
jgi:hypothetical protein